MKLRCLLALMMLGIFPLWPSAAGQLFRHPEGFYAIEAPEGWSVDVSGETVRLTKDRSYTNILVLDEVLPESAAQVFVNQAKSQWKNFRPMESRPSTVGGQPAVLRVHEGMNPQNVRAVLHVTAVTVSGRTFVFLSSAPITEYGEARSVFEQIERSFLPGGLGGAPAPAPPSAPVPAATPPPTVPVAPAPVRQPETGPIYRDPKRRFEIAVPAGWSAAESEGGVRISRGNAYANVVLFEGAGGGWSVAEQVVRQVGQQWRDFQEIQRGDTQLGTLPAKLGVYSGVNPKGVPALLKVIAAAGPGHTYMLLLSAPQNEFGTVGADLSQIEQGFSTGGGPAPAPAQAAAPPSPPPKPVPVQAPVPAARAPAPAATGRRAFAGVWKLNPALSDYQGRTAPREGLLTVDLAEAELRFEARVTNAAGQTNTSKDLLRLDGTERVYQNTIRIEGHWDGEKVVWSRRSGDTRSLRVWVSVSPDGKRLTWVTEAREGAEVKVNTEVFERQ
jgi:hypothetical protein